MQNDSTKEQTIRINYDDQPDDIMSKVGNALKAFGVSVDVVDGPSDGTVRYRFTSAGATKP